MPYEYSIDIDRRLVMTNCWGDLIDRDMFEYQARLVADPGFTNDCSLLMDMSNATSSKGLTANAVRSAAGRRLYGPQSRQAVVAPTQDLFGLARMFDTYREMAGGQGQFRVFTDRKEALSWLTGDLEV